MTLGCGSTGSSGNAYYIEHNNEILLLDAGIKLSDIKKMIDFRIGDVAGVLISHCHL